MDPLDIVLRLVGSFYLFAGLLGLHAMAADELMDQVLAALTLEPTPRAEAVRRWLLRGGSLMVGISGAALMVLSLWAVPLFVAATVLQAAWLIWARKHYPASDPLEAKGRRQTTNAAILFGLVTMLVIWLGASGQLHPWSDPWALFIPVAALALVAFAGRSLISKPLARFTPEPMDKAGDDEDDLPLAPRPDRIRIEPTWGGHDILDADTGLPFAYFDYVSHDLGNRIHYWSYAFRSNDDEQSREFWAQFESPADEAAHRAEGDALAVELTAIFGPGNVIGPIYPADIRYAGPDVKARET